MKKTSRKPLKIKLFSPGFTIMELLIVIGVLGILAIGILAAIDPFEQLKRGRDNVLREIATNVYTATIRSFGTQGKLPSSENYIGVKMGSLTGTELINYLMGVGELKSSFWGGAESAKNLIFITAFTNGSKITVCYLPESKAFKNSEAKYDTTGFPQTNCSLQNCYACIGSIQSEPLAGPISTDSPTTSEKTVASSESEDKCAVFDPEYPEFAFTCNNSSKWSKYGCTNYCVADLGCGNECPEGQRRLAKTYYAVQGQAFADCLDKKSETIEYYCVSGTSAGCEIKNYSSSADDYVWGCTGPRRPNSWK
jgi:type II secretory pathway pseudopilin PulG